jgi:DNA-binding MarR family transcriptional regulator
MELTQRQALAEAIVEASSALVGIAVRSIAAVQDGVTVVQHRVLVLLDSHQILSVSEVAVRLGVDQSVASRHCARLEELGLVDRSRSARDGRSREVSLTEAGRRRVSAVRAARRRAVEEVLGRMSDIDGEAARHCLEAFSRAAERPGNPSVAPAR